MFDWITGIISGILGAGNAVSSGVQLASTVVEALFNGKMWRSLGWLILGLIIMGIGLLLWLRAPIENAAGTVGKAVAF